MCIPLGSPWKRSEEGFSGKGPAVGHAGLALTLSQDVWQFGVETCVVVLSHFSECRGELVWASSFITCILEWVHSESLGGGDKLRNRSGRELAVSSERTC